nr:hypothetical protein [Tanacetum cinerariifolium]
MALINPARNMLADSLLPTTFCAEAVNTACYVLNRDVNTNSTNLLNVVSTPVSAVRSSRALNDDEPSYPVDPSMPHLEDIYACQRAEIFTNLSYDDEGVVTDFNNLETTMSVSPTPTTRIYTIYPKSQILGDPLSAVQTRSKVHKNSKAHALCDGFEELMKNRFQMSSMGELTFFLRLQVKQKEDGIFISQDKYVAEILKKFDFLSVKTVCACSRFQVTLKTSHLQAVKRIFRYLKGQPKLGLWYPKVSLFDMEAYSDNDYAGANLDRKSTTGGFEQIIDFLNESSVRYVLTARPTIRTSCIKQFWSTAKVKTVNDEVRVQALIDAKRVNIKESSIRHTLKLDDEEVLKPPPEMNLAALWHQQSYALPQTRSLTSQVDHQLWDMYHHQDIYDNPSLTKKVYANMKRVGTGFSRVITPLFENMLVLAAEEVGQAQDDVSIPTEPSTFKPHKKHKSKKHQPKAPMVPSPESSPEYIIPLPSNDPIPDANKDNLKFQELMDLCTRLSNKVLDLESEVIDITSSFTNKIEKLKDKVHKLEEENKILKEKSFKSAKFDTVAPDIDKEEPAEVEEVLKVVTAAKLITEVVTTAEPTTTVAQVPKASAPRRKRGVVIQDYEETTTSVIMHTKVQPKDKGKGILIEKPKPLKGQAQIKQDEAFARQLEAELNTNINWNDVTEQVKRSERQNNAVMRYQALKRKPLTEAQARKNMMIYLHNMAGCKMNFFKGMTYSVIRPMFENH